MAKAYRWVKEGPGRGMEIQKAMAYQEDVQAKLAYTASYRAARAQTILKMHRFANHSFIQLVHGDVDYHIILNDERGQKAAMTIEFGRVGGNHDVNGNLVAPMDPVAPLRKAVGLW